MKVFLRLLPYLRPYRHRFFQAALAMIVVAVANGGPVYLLRSLIDKAFISKDFKWLWLCIILIPTLLGIKNVAAYIQNYLMSWLGQKATQTLREDLFRHLHTLSLDFFAEKKSAEILSRVTNDLGNLQSALQFLPLYLIRDSLMVVVLSGLLFVMNWRFALILMLVIPIVSVLLAVLSRKMRDASLQSQAIMGQIYHRFQESLQSMMLIKAFNFEEGAAEKFRAENMSFFNQTMRYLRAAALSGPLMEVCGALPLMAMVYFGGREIIRDQMTPGAFFAIIVAGLSAYSPIKNLTRTNSELQRGLASGERIFQLLDERPTVLEERGGKRFSGLREALRFESVVFRYPSRDLPALRGVDIEVRRGERVAIVGPSGSGKSTLVALLLRLYDPDRGRVVIDGEDLKSLDVRSVRERFGLVTQETILYNETVFHNVALGRREADAEAVRRACAVADADRFIRALPQGYETQLGDRGLKLSGGQRQRLAIARAVLKDPSVLVLDEATSNLDSESEVEVQGALERLMEGRTTLVIAHRLSTVQGADRICVLNEGEVAEAGSHSDLIGRDGLYRRLFEIQKADPRASGAPA
jgi:subfamily B ATP-binding cassette protein MsbA